MGARVNYTIVGIFVLSLSVLIILFFLWLTAWKNSEVYNFYLVYMHEEVTGLNVRGPVRYNGVRVGYIQSIKLSPDDPQQVVLKLAIQAGTPVTTSTIARLVSEGIAGGTYVGLKALTAQALLLKAKPGEKYPVIPSEPSLLLKLSTELQSVAFSLKQVANNFNKLLDDEHQRKVQYIISHIEHITAALSNRSDDIENLIRTLNVTTQNVAGQLIPSVELLLNRLNIMTSHFSGFSRDLARHPSILLRGKSPVPLGPGEAEESASQ